MRIVLVGPPGCGKGTQATRLAARFGIVHLSVGDLLRSEAAAGSDLGRRAAQIMASGELVDDDLIIELMDPKITAAAQGRGYLLDGYPRSEPQAAALLAMDTAPEVAIALEVPEPVLVDRILHRAEVEGRADDTAEVIGNRVAVYRRSTEPLLAMFADRGLLRIVDADVDPAAVTVAIIEQLENMTSR
ncbi:adenylate kinase [Amycolatopsis sp. cg13]|uniref:adenylate kinase n=1 Tax=Amycolatopsis sp. cg13 TaxID=3238807 RepID=UPI003525EE6C